MDPSHERYGSLKTVMGVIGLKAAGKDEFCQRLHDVGFEVFLMSDPIREEAGLRGIEKPTIRDLQDISDEMKRAHGAGVWAKRILDTAVERGLERIVLNGIRNPGEIGVLRSCVGDRFVLAGITAPTLLRARRLIDRARPGDPTTLEEFLAMDDRDRGIGQAEDGQQVDRCFAQVPLPHIIVNDSTLDIFQDRIWALLYRLAQEQSEVPISMPQRP